MADTSASGGKTVAYERRAGSGAPARPQDRALVADEAPIRLVRHELTADVRLDARLVLHHRPESERAAHVRILRHHLLERGRPQAIVVTSAGSGEGKTTCAANLALALAEHGRARVLLVEAAVRRPELAAIFGFVPPWCFAEQLQAHRQQPHLPWSLVDIPVLGVHVAAMKPGVERGQLHDGPAFAAAMDRLRVAGYDHIVIDAPPVLGSAEVNLIQDAADGVLLVCRARDTTARALRAAVEQLGPTRILATALMEA